MCLWVTRSSIDVRIRNISSRHASAQCRCRPCWVLVRILSTKVNATRHIGLCCEWLRRAISSIRGHWRAVRAVRWKRRTIGAIRRQRRSKSTIMLKLLSHCRRAAHGCSACYRIGMRCRRRALLCCRNRSFSILDPTVSRPARGSVMAIVLAILVIVASPCSATLSTRSIVNLVEVVSPVVRLCIRPLRSVTFGSIASVSVVVRVTIVVVLVFAVMPRASFAHVSIPTLLLFQVVFQLLLFGLIEASRNLVEPRIRNLVSAPHDTS